MTNFVAEKPLTVEEYYSLYKETLLDKLKTPYRYLVSMKYDTYSSYEYATKEQALEGGKNYVRNYLDEIIEETDTYIVGKKYDRTMKFRLAVDSRVETVEEQLKELEEMYIIYANYQKDFSELLEKHDLKGFFRCGSSLSLTSFDGYDTYATGLEMINLETNEVKKIYTWCDNQCSQKFMDEVNRNKGLENLPYCKIGKIVANNNREIESRNSWHERGDFCLYDLVEIVSGRKLPIGTIKEVVKFEPYKDCYGRLTTVYAHFSDGTRTSRDNCQLLEPTEHRKHLFFK